MAWPQTSLTGGLASVREREVKGAEDGRGREEKRREKRWEKGGEACISHICNIKGGQPFCQPSYCMLVWTATSSPVVCCRRMGQVNTEWYLRSQPRLTSHGSSSRLHMSDTCLCTMTDLRWRSWGRAEQPAERLCGMMRRRRYAQVESSITR